MKPLTKRFNTNVTLYSVGKFHVNAEIGQHKTRGPYEGGRITERSCRNIPSDTKYARNGEFMARVPNFSGIPKYFIVESYTLNNYDICLFLIISLRS